jgi:AcrR family transcriptional regulator
MESGAPRGRGRPRRFETRDSILREAVSLFASQGYTETTLDDIASAVGIRKPSLYHYIETKEDLLYEIDSLLIAELLEETERLLATADTPAGRLRAFFVAGMRLIAHRRGEVTVFLGEVPSPSGARWTQLASKRDSYQRLFEKILRDGVADGSFRNLPTTVTALGALGTTSWAYRWYRGDGEMGPDETAELFADVVLNGLRPR